MQGSLNEKASRVAVIGAGMAGLSCAEELSHRGLEVVLFDKGRGPGGRMSTRRIDTVLGQVRLDHGAQYFTVRDDRFRRVVAEWADRGVAVPWPPAGPDAWIGKPAMNSVIRDMAGRHAVNWATLVERIEPGLGGWWLHAGDTTFGAFDAVVLAVPAEQALPFLSLHDFAMARQAMLARSQPCWTAMFVFGEEVSSPTDILRDAGDLGWAARNSSKPGRQGPESWVVQARPEWSRDHLEDAAPAVADALLAELGRQLGRDLPRPVTATAHRWRYAMNAGIGLGALWNGRLALGVCGDWLLGPRVECAWQSGHELALTMLEPASAAAAQQPTT